MRDSDYVVMNPRGVEIALTSAQTKAAVLATAQGLAEAASAMSKHEYDAVLSRDKKVARAAVVPQSMHAINSENLHHWLNRILP